MTAPATSPGMSRMQPAAKAQLTIARRSEGRNVPNGGGGSLSVSSLSVSTPRA